jgi:hypothetical protein
MAAGNWIVYDSAKVYMADGTMDMNSNTFKVMLCKNAYSPLRSSHTIKSQVTDEVDAVNGYTAGGVALTSVTYTQSAGVATWDCADPTWTASGGSIAQARIAVIYNDTVSSPVKPLVCYCIMDTTDVTATVGQILTIQMSASGILTLSGATT